MVGRYYCSPEQFRKTVYYIKGLCAYTSGASKYGYILFILNNFNFVLDILPELTFLRYAIIPAL